MSDKYKVDSHKLIYHPAWVTNWMESKDDWEKAKKIYPIYVEISPVGYCNHRCNFCAVDFMEYKKIYLDTATLKNTIKDMAAGGIKSIMFAGEGEPLLHKDLPEIIKYCSEIGIDTSLTTNMVPMIAKNIEIYMKYCKWIKVSLNAGCAKNYAKIHGTNEKDFYRVLDNLRKCVAVKREKGYTCTIGTQSLLLPDNLECIENLAKLSKEIGIDYTVIKPYSQHMASVTCKYKDLDYSKFMYLENNLKKYSSNNFEVIFRTKTMKKMFEDFDRYQKCNAVPFLWGYLVSDGNFFGCSCFLDNEEFCYGNINEMSFKKIWEGEKRKKNYDFVRNDMKIEGCRQNCRMDEINRYLWELSNPSEHVNFI